MHNAAREFAIGFHGDQKYGTRPYSFHLDAVAGIAEPYGDLARTVAYLHDTVEDTACTLEEIRGRFGDLAARCVAILTDEPGESRKVRKDKTYAKMAGVSGDETTALVVKAADRLANLRASIGDDDTRLIGIYRSEHPAFRKAAFRPGLCDDLWAELDRLAEELA